MTERDGNYGDAIQLIAQRVEFLDRLGDAALDKPELVAELDYSRSTVDRAIRELELAGFIEPGEAGYRTTLSGRLVADRHRGYVYHCIDLIDAQDVLNQLSVEAPIEAAFFRGATISRGTETTPYSPLETVSEQLSTATRIRALVPVLADPGLLELVRDRVVDDGVDVALVAESTLCRELSRSNRALVSEMVESGRVAVRTGDVPEFTLLLLETDERASTLLVVHTDAGMIHSVVRNDAPAARRWAESLFERAHADARAVAADLTGEPAADEE